MKNLLLISALCLALAGCGTSSPIKFAEKHCKPKYDYNKQTGVTTATYECVGLWTWEQGKKHVLAAEVCVDPVNGNVTGVVMFDSTSKVSKLYEKK